MRNLRLESYHRLSHAVTRNSTVMGLNLSAFNVTPKGNGPDISVRPITISIIRTFSLDSLSGRWRFLTYDVQRLHDRVENTPLCISLLKGLL